MIMSTHDGPGIPFEICNDGEHLRLVELPPSLLEMITSKRLSNLMLKSSQPITSGQTTANAVLCTDNQTYQIRQVQSSNSVFILQPSESKLDGGSNPSSSLSAIAQSTATLELVPAAPHAIKYLKHALPVYNGDSFTESAAAWAPNGGASIQSLIQDAPFSLREFNCASKELCAFELNGLAWLPTVSVLANTWKSIISAATVRSIDLGKSFSITTLIGIVGDDGYPSNLFKAVMVRLGADDQDIRDDCAVLNKGMTVRWVGNILLESQPPFAEGLSASDFLQCWQDQLPEHWRSLATLELLKCSEPNNGKIAFDDTGGDTKANSTPIKIDGKSSRNWHEKFKNARP